MQLSDHSLTRKQAITFVALTVFGVAALVLGVALIIYLRYHERAYVFLGLGAGSFIGGIAGIVVAESKIKAALSYGVIALGVMGIMVGINYQMNIYGSDPNQTRGDIVIALSTVAILVGIVEALFAQRKVGIAVFSSVIMLGLIASMGVMALIVGTVYLVVLQQQEHAYLLLGAGVVCLLSGITFGAFYQSRVRATSR